VLVSCCIWALAGTAQAQDISNEVAARDGTVSAAEAGRTWDNIKLFGAETIQERDRSEFKPLGLRIGNFYFYPDSGVRLIATDNVFNSPTNKQHDLITETTAGLKITSNTSRHYFDFAFGGRFTKHAEHDELDRLDGNAAATASIRVDSAHTIGAVLASNYGHLSNLDPSLPNSVSEPIPFWTQHAALSFKRDAGRMWASIGATATSTTHYNVRTVDGRLLDTSYRDLDVLRSTLQVGYRFSPGYQLQAKVTGTRQETPGNKPFDLDAWGYEAAVGLAAEFNPLLRMRLFGGYGVRDYDRFWATTGRTLGSAELIWLPTQLTTVTFTAGRTMNDGSTAFGTSGYVSNSLGLKLDYEIWRNLVFTVEGQYHALEYLSAQRRDNLYVGRSTLDYLANRNMSFQLGFEHVTRQSNFEQESLASNRIWVGARLRF
jgi:hypothetical protein